MQQLPTNPLELAIWLTESVWERAKEGRSLTFTVPPSAAFSNIEDASEAASILVAGNENSRQLEIALPAQFFYGMSDFLEHPARRTTIPPRFYLAELKFLHPSDGGDIPDQVQKYFEAVSLFQLLGGLADHEVKSGGLFDLVFLGKEKIVITPDYCAGDLASLDRIEGFREEFIDSATHSEQRTTILKTALHEMFHGQPKVSLGSVLARFHDLVERANNGYQLYVSEFSFEKVKAEVEKEKTEFTARLNKVFSDIQNQLLAVPAALILVGGQMKNVGRIEIANSLIWLGALVFAILMNLLIRNQRNTLQVVHQEFRHQWNRIKGNHKGVAQQFDDAYKHLETRYNHQRRLLWVVDGLVAGSLVVTTILLCRYSRLFPFG